MKKLLPIVIAALMIPSVASAKGKPPTAGTHTNHGKAKVMYVLRGLLYNYTPYVAATGTTAAQDGSIQIVVQHSNRHGKLLRSDPNNNPVYVTIDIGQKTMVRLDDGMTSIANGDRGAVQVRASKLAFKGATQADVLAALANQPAHMVTDRGAAG